jgi:hypothetical protein
MPPGASSFFEAAPAPDCGGLARITAGEEAKGQKKIRAAAIQRKPQGSESRLGHCSRMTPDALLAPAEGLMNRVIGEIRCARGVLNHHHG